MSIRYAFVTLLTSDDYLQGAITIPAALRDVHPPDQTVEYETVCLVTPETVDVSSIRTLRKAFDVVIGVETIVQSDTESLGLLGRPDLDTALTKLHVFRLTQYSKIIFLDADVLPLRPLSHLFLLDHEFSAAPDVGWPDIFNSGVMVLSPGEDKFEELRELLNTKGTWDGADQGLLNEWRGDNWNRLSFTYNTTPTAIYTYAPAYQRFGSQISVIHFIGPHKPWHSIVGRTPGPSAQSTHMILESSTEFPAAQARAFDYDSLVDRWHSVYDRHYQSQATGPAFQPTRYTSAWNEEGPHRGAAASGALGLEELRRAALEGMGPSGISAPRAHGEGEYRTMPLEGRFDLIRPRTRAEKKREQEQEQEQEQTQAQTQKESARAAGSTPVPVESPSTPVEPPSTLPEPSTPPRKIVSLSSGSPVRWSTLPTPGVDEIPPAPHARLMSLPPTPLRYVPAPYKPHRHTRDAEAQTLPIRSQQQESGGKDLSPTPITCSSAVETPPNVATPIPMDTYSPKGWDVDRLWSSISPSSSETSLTTMEPSPTKLQPGPIALSTQSVEPGAPEALRHTGQHRNIVGEEDRSPTPDPTKLKRVFPWEERPRPTPGRVFPDRAQGSPLATLSRFPVTATATPERKISLRSPMPSPLFGFPPSFQSHHPPDGHLFQRYAGKAPRSVLSSSPLGPESGLGGVETSSQDGDVEDEVESEEETVVRSRMRSSSISMVKRTSKYRSIGVQTDPREVREEGVQVTTFVPVAEVAEKLRLMNRHWGHSRLTSPGTAKSLSVAPKHVATSPLSPAALDFQHSLLPSNFDEHRAPSMSPLDETSDSSPSLGPPLPSISPTALPSSHPRKGSRVWDPARGVETFKQGSEEALTKFMKNGPVEERA